MKRLGFAVKTPFQNYIALKAQFNKEHPKAVIIEEIKTLTLETLKVPHPTLIGKMMEQQTIMIAWGIVFEEELAVVELDKNLITLTTNKDK